MNYDLPKKAQYMIYASIFFTNRIVNIRYDAIQYIICTEKLTGKLPV